MQLINHIFDVLGEATRIAGRTGDPVQTVHSWKAKGNIPHWRRGALLAVPPRKGKTLSAEALLYLASRERVEPQPLNRPEQLSNIRTDAQSGSAGRQARCR